MQYGMNSKIIHLNTIDSTHYYALKNAEKMADFTFVYADFQTNGVGRNDRNWVSRSRDSLLMSVVLKPKIDISQIPLITPVLCLAVIDFLQDIGIDSLIKWPNDIIVKKKKIAGVLAGASVKKDELDFVVASLGLNIKQPEQELLKIDQPATSILNELDKVISKKEVGSEVNFLSLPDLIGQSISLLDSAKGGSAFGGKLESQLNIEFVLNSIIDKFKCLYKQFLTNGFFDLFSTWKKRMLLIQDQVLIDLGKRVIKAKIIDYNIDGSIQIIDEKGQKHNYIAGEIIKLNNSPGVS